MTILPHHANRGENYNENCTICKDQCDDEETNIHSGFPRHMTAATASLNKTTPSVVDYRAIYYGPNYTVDIGVQSKLEYTGNMS